MGTLMRPAERIKQARRFAWLLAPVITIPTSYVLALLRVHDAPWWLGLVVGAAATPIAGALLSRALSASVEDLIVARLGSSDERSRRLAEPVNRLTPATTRAALALEAGALSAVPMLLASLTRVDRKQGLFVLVTHRQALLTGDPLTQQGAIDALLTWRGLGRFGLHREIARYHAFILVCALAGRAVDDPSVLAATRRLAADRDFEIRAYATWLAGDSDVHDSEVLTAGAALARAAGRETLARTLELRAARRAPGANPSAPYRAA